ncbi:MAG: AraC family transcriptional regulator [Eubacteriales bacterium]
MEIDLTAPGIISFCFPFSSAEYNGSAPEGYTEALAKGSRYVLFSLARGFDPVSLEYHHACRAHQRRLEEIDERTQRCVSGIQSLCEEAGREVNWHIACGTPVARLSVLPMCFGGEPHSLLPLSLPAEHILTEESIQNLQKAHTGEPASRKPEIDQERVRCFISSGSAEEIDPFIEQLLHSAGEDGVPLAMFCRYLIMTAYFAAAAYIDSLKCHADSFWPPELRPKDNIATPDEARGYLRQIMQHAIRLRDRESKKQQHDLLKKAIAFIDESYPDESISLDKVAQRVNISPNYFSAMFSQEIGQTFVEYLTSKRISEAKRMLRQTEMRSSEIAYAVGFRDSHYFSFVFKKVTGSTPSEYRKGDKR